MRDNALFDHIQRRSALADVLVCVGVLITAPYHSPRCLLGQAWSGEVGLGSDSKPTTAAEVTAADIGSDRNNFCFSFLIIIFFATDFVFFP